jgi:hypothetical protein
VAAALAAYGLAAAFGETFEEPGEPRFADLLTDEPHSQMPLWLLGSIGSACAVLGGMLLLADRLPRATWPLAATGQLALTVYVGHLLLLAAHPVLVEREAVPAASFSVAAFMLLAAAACTLWRAVLPRGPLEAALAAPWWIIERIFRRVVRRLATRRGTGGVVVAAVALMLAAGVILAVTYTGSGDDYKIGSNIPDVFDVDGGNDAAQGRGGEDILKLGSGDDLALAGDGTDRYYGSYGDDALSEHDWWGLPETNCTSVSSDFSACTGGDTMYGGNGDDYLEGANGGDYLYGGADVDLVFGDPGPDVIRGGADEDFLYGEQGSDNINGGMGDDEIAGGSGNDTLHGHSGAETIDAADGELDYIYCGDDGDLDTVYADVVDRIDPSCQNNDVNKVSATSPAAAAEGGANADDKQEQERDKRLVDRQQ